MKACLSPLGDHNLSLPHNCQLCEGLTSQAEGMCVRAAAGQQQSAPTASAAASEASSAPDALEQTAETPAEGKPSSCLLTTWGGHEVQVIAHAHMCMSYYKKCTVAA